MKSPFRRRMAMGASLSALIATPALAQAPNDPQGFDDEIIVTGVRASLEQSLDFERASTTIVDVVTAEDVGKFPDNNVAEALQRITGVAIDRTGGEGQFITVRGLGPEFNIVTLNGRTLATDNAGREFSFDILSSDVIQRAEVFKTSDATLQSGGIGALVNVVTARPFDSRGPGFAAQVSGTYDTLDESISPEASVLGNWTNDEGTFGVVGSLSYSNRNATIDRVFTNGFAERTGNLIVAAPESSTGLGEDALGALPAGARVQQQVVVSRDDQERERITANGTIQFAPVDTFTLTLDGLYSEFTIDSFDSQFSGFFSPPFIDPVIDANGTVVSFSRPGQDFLTRNPAIAGQIGLSQNDNVITSNNRNADTYLFGANADWELSDTVGFNADISRSVATNDATNPFVVLGALAPESPLIQLPDDAEISTLTNIVGAQDTSIQRLHFVNVARTQVEDEITELRGAFDWAPGAFSIANITVGASYTDRTKTQNNFDNFSPTQGAGIFCAYCGYTVDFDDSILSPITLDDFLGGVDGSDRIPTSFLISTFEEAFAALNATANITAADRSGRSTIGDAELIRRRDANAGSIFGFYTPEFNPAGSFVVNEEVTSAFINAAFDGDFGAMPFSANLGLRVSETSVTSSGVDNPVVEFRESVGDTQLVPVFGPAQTITVENDYTNYLPSANIKLETTEDTAVRLAVSKTVTRPTLTSLGVNNVFGGRSNAPTSGGGNPNLEAFESWNFDGAFEWFFDDISYFAVNGFHKEFSNFLEVATVGIPGEVVIPAGNASNPGATDITVPVTFQDTRTRNGEDGSITGVELALQKAFDNGFGGTVNYTYVTSDIDRAPGSPVADLDYNGLSPHSVNVSAFYENGPIQARIAYNWRDEFLVQGQSFFSEPQQREAYGQLDLSAAYEISDSIQIFAEGVNILDEDRRDFSRFENRFLIYEDTGSRYTLGLRGKF